MLDAPAPGSLRILLVEDHVDTLRLTARLLASFGHQVVAVESAPAALEAARREAFDLVISDLGLPEMSGLELMQQLRAQHHLKGIALSGYGTDEDIARSRAAGFAEHLVKPVDFAKLQAAMQRVAATADAGV